MKLKFRWPIYSYECDDCGHTTRRWQKPWYAHRPRGPLSMYVDSIDLGPTGPLFSEEALVLIGKTTEDFRKLTADDAFNWSTHSVFRVEP